jgi:hypothetical protein
MRDQTVLFVDFNELHGQAGRMLRSIPSEVEPILADPSVANMDFAEFADNANPDGIFCGIWLASARPVSGSAADRLDGPDRHGPGRDLAVFTTGRAGTCRPA